MHDVGVVLAGEDVSRAAHIGGELVDFVESLSTTARQTRLIAQVADDEVVGLGFGVFVEFEIDAAHPESFALQSFDQVAADEAAGSAHNCSLLHLIPRDCISDNCVPEYRLSKDRGDGFGA